MDRTRADGPHGYSNCNRCTSKRALWMWLLAWGENFSGWWESKWIWSESVSSSFVLPVLLFLTAVTSQRRHVLPHHHPARSFVVLSCPITTDPVTWSSVLWRTTTLSNVSVHRCVCCCFYSPSAFVCQWKAAEKFPEMWVVKCTEPPLTSVSQSIRDAIIQPEERRKGKRKGRRNEQRKEEWKKNKETEMKARQQW